MMSSNATRETMVTGMKDLKRFTARKYRKEWGLLNCWRSDLCGHVITKDYPHNFGIDFLLFFSRIQLYFIIALFPHDFNFYFEIGIYILREGPVQFCF